MAQRLGRKPFIWDNHLANDGKERSAHLYLNPFDNGESPNSALVAGVAINPMNQPSLSRVPLAAYAARFCNDAAVKEGAYFKALVQLICGPVLGPEIFGDLDLFQYRGISDLDGSARVELIEKYGRFEAHRLAVELCAWLRGDYDFDPNCLTT